MKTWKKIVIVIAVTVAFIVFVPYLRYSVMDGGTKGRGSVVYQVYKYHRYADYDFDDVEEIDGYQAYEVGWSFAIFDHEVYKNTHIIQEKEDYE